MLGLAAVALALASGGAPADPLVLRVDGGPSALAVGDGRVWVASPRAGTVSAYDAGSGATLSTVRTGGAPTRISLAASGLWVADGAAGTVIGVRKGRALPAVAVGADASDLVLANGAVWTASSADGRVYVHDARGTRAIQAGRTPVALASDGKLVYVADAQGGRLTIIDAPAALEDARVSMTSIGGAPVDVALSDGTAWLADATNERVVAALGGGVRESVPVGARPIALATAGEDVYVVTADEHLLRIRDGRVRSRRELGGAPAAVAVDRERVWVALPAENRVLRFDR